MPGGDRIPSGWESGPSGGALITDYFIDSDNGNDGNDGLGTGTAWKTFDQFTENARSAGDTATARNSMTALYSNGTDLLFTSDGTIVAPIILRRDYADAFSDDVDLSVTATATLTFGSKTVTYSADISGVLAVGDWIYAASDDAELFSYEVAAVSTVTVTLFLPYKGAQAGSGKTTTNIGSPPIWGTVAGNFQVNIDNDDHWDFAGIHFRGTDNNGAVEVDSSAGTRFRDCIFEVNGSLDMALVVQADVGPLVLVQKGRFLNYLRGIGGGGFNGVNHGMIVKDSLLDGNSVSSSKGIDLGRTLGVRFEECEFKNHTTGDVALRVSGPLALLQSVYLRNCILASVTEVDVHDTATASFVGIEGHDGTPGDTRQLTHLSTAEGTPILQSDTGTIRTGTPSIKVTPSADLAPAWEHSRVKLFEYGIYATTASKKYEIFFRPTATADWTADPVAGELWIETEFWGHASNNFRQIVKSTEVIDMNGSTSFTALSVTVAPGQAGVLYLRAYYAKTKESGKANTFFCDPVPVIT